MTSWEHILFRKLNFLHENLTKYDVFIEGVGINEEISPFLVILPVSSLLSGQDFTYFESYDFPV